MFAYLLRAGYLLTKTFILLFTQDVFVVTLIIWYKLMFQGFLEANLKCFWNTALVEAVRVLEFQGYVAPGVLLVKANPCALEVIRAGWARNVLKPPANYSISIVGKFTQLYTIRIIINLLVSM